MFFEKEEKVRVFIASKNDVLCEAFFDFSQTIASLSGNPSQLLENFDISSLSHDTKGIALCNLENEKNLRAQFFAETEKLSGTDGFCVRRVGDVIFILSWLDEGLYYGLHDLLEENFDIVYSRGALEYDYDYIPSKKLRFEKCYYEKISPFVDRAINMCGIGTEGKDHRDYGSARYYARNMINHIDVYDEGWKKFGYRFNYSNRSMLNIDDLIDTNPEYFMTDVYGNPKKSPHESYINYTNREAALVVAQRCKEAIARMPKRCYLWSVMPDDPTFYVKHGGVEISAQPYTTAEGITVYPERKNYKSTVYFDFYNTVVKEIVKDYPDLQMVTLAYLYAEEAPAVEIDEHLIVALAPIKANDRYSFVAEGETGNAEARRNIENWAKVCKNLSLYTYWFSFKGEIYSRPILKAVQENLLWLKSIGVKRLLLETLLECTYEEGMSERQLRQRRWFDMNEGYLWAVQKLLIEPERDIDELLRRYCKIVYKECAEAMYGYFKAVEKGYESQDAYVWYAVGGDVYTHQCIVKAGVADEILACLEEAKKAATSPKVKSRVDSIYAIVKGEIDKYATYVDEACTIAYCDVGKEKLLSKEQALYHNNADSVWHRATPLKILRDYDTFAYYDERAKFECRTLYDERNVYVAYCVFDDTLEKAELGADGQIVLTRTNGKPVLSYAETYIGGNALNQSVYYGVISGFDAQKGLLQLYRNEGTPVERPIPKGMEDRRFAHLEDVPEKRYSVHIQVIPIESLDSTLQDFTPYGSFVYYTNRYGRAGWKGIGLWSKNNFSSFHLEKIKRKGEVKNGN